MALFIAVGPPICNNALPPTMQEKAVNTPVLAFLWNWCIMKSLLPKKRR